jgi:hypothetical protein
MAYEGFWLDGISLEEDPVVVLCGQDNELAGCLKHEEYLERRSSYKVFKEDLAPSFFSWR